MSKAPLVSIVTVVYNGAAHLEQTIQSVLGQTYKNIEYIIIDGGSTDGTLNIIERYSSKLGYWVSEPDKGIYDAMNKGIRHCKGELIGLKNADDWYTENAVENAVAAYLNRDADVVYGDTLMVWQENPLKTSLFHSDHNQLKIGNGGVDHRTMFVKAELYKQKLYDARFRISADYDWMMWSIRQGHNWVHAGTVLSYKRGGGASAGLRTVKEMFRLNMRHHGLFLAARTAGRSLWAMATLGTGNWLLKSLLGEKRFAAFKSRNRKLL